MIPVTSLLDSHFPSSPFKKEKRLYLFDTADCTDYKAKVAISHYVTALFDDS